MSLTPLLSMDKTALIFAGQGSPWQTALADAILVDRHDFPAQLDTLRRAQVSHAIVLDLARLHI